MPNKKEVLRISRSLYTHKSENKRSDNKHAGKRPTQWIHCRIGANAIVLKQSDDLQKYSALSAFCIMREEKEQIKRKAGNPESDKCEKHPFGQNRLQQRIC